MVTCGVPDSNQNRPRILAAFQNGATMKRIRVGMLIAGLAAVLPAEEPAKLLAVKAGRLIDVKSGAVVPNAVVLVENGRVKAVGPSVAIPAGAPVIDLSGYTVLPGLID